MRRILRRGKSVVCCKLLSDNTLLPFCRVLYRPLTWLVDKRSIAYLSTVVRATKEPGKRLQSTDQPGRDLIERISFSLPCSSGYQARGVHDFTVQLYRSFNLNP